MYVCIWVDSVLGILFGYSKTICMNHIIILSNVTITIIILMNCSITNYGS